MRFFFLALILTFIQQLQAANYYFSSSTGDDSRTAGQAQQVSTPWKTIARLNAAMPTLLPGDSILFKRGDVFFGSIVVSRSGTSSQPIVFAAYGTGVKPVISGLTRLTNWVSAGSNTWETTVDVIPMINMLLLNGEQKPIGRWPDIKAANKGYLTIDGTSGNTAITDNELSGSPNWNGGEVVIRKNRWVIDRNYITSHSGNTIIYNSSSPNHPANGFGYFIQNHPKTLDQQGEWYYHQNTKKLGIYFSTGDPAAAMIQASTIHTLVSIQNQSNIIFDDLTFIGANESAFQVHHAVRIRISNSEIRFSGANAITATNTQQLVIENNEINHTNNIAIHQENCLNSSITKNIITNTGMIAGMGKNDSGAYEAIMLTGDNHLIEDNRILNTGYIPITFRGNTNIIRRNFINHFALVKDDASGIYTWNNIPNSPATFGSKIINNMIFNGRGAGEGTDNPVYLAANGIYMDDNSANVEITGNTVANNPLHGIYIHNAHEIKIADNTLFNNGSQLALVTDAIAEYSPVRNIMMHGNIFFSKEVYQPAAEFKTHRNDLDAFGTFDSNYYARPANDNFSINVSYFDGVHVNKAMNLDDWKRLYNKDISSQISPVIVASPDVIRFEYNESYSEKAIALDQPYVDVRNNFYSGSVMLKPFTSLILLPKTSSVPGSSNCPSTGTILREQWDNVTGNDIANIPLGKAPSSSSVLSNLQTVQVGDNYAARISGFICPPETGQYTFYLSADDAAELWLSTDENPANKKKIAGILSYTDFNEWNKFPTQTSVKITLNAGQRYYIEVLHKEGGGGDHLAVGWQLPDGQREMPIPGKRLSTAVTLPQQPQPEPVQAACKVTGTILREIWFNAGGTGISDIPVTRSPGRSDQLNSLHTENIGDNYGERLRGFLCVPQTGNYKFLVAGDDAVEVWLSTDELPISKKLIASIPGYTDVNQWNKYPSQASAAIYLKTGQRYYIEVLHKEGGGGDHVTVSWELPDGKRETPISGSWLSSFTATPVSDVTVCQATGSILREQWDNVAGNNVSNIPLNNAPSSSAQLSSLQTIEAGDNYGARLRGYICPPQTGNYLFFLSGDDAAELWLSTDEHPSSKVKVASLLSYTGVQEFNKYPSQSSNAYYLEAGKKYYIEVLHKEGGGGDHLSIGWQLPDGTREAPVPGNRLSPFTAIPGIPVQPCIAVGSISLEQWLNVTGFTIADIPLTRPADKVSHLSALQTYHMADHYGLRLRGFVCAPLDGYYTFSVAGDDAVELWLSSNEDPANKKRIVNLSAYTGFQEWFKWPSQTSDPVFLKAGHRYYMEVLQIEINGADHISIGWHLPNKMAEFPIGGNRLSPFTSAGGQQLSSNTARYGSLYEMQKKSSGQLHAYPVPFKNTATIIVKPEVTGDVKLELYDLNGKLLRKIFSGTMQSGASASFELEASELADGVYILRLTTKADVIQQKISLLR